MTCVLICSTAVQCVWPILCLFEVAGASAVELAQKAVAPRPEGACYRGTLGIVRYRAGDYEKVLDALRRAERLRQGGTGYDLFFAAMAEWRLGRKDQAHELFDRAVAWQAANEPDEPQLQAFRAEAKALLDSAAKN